MKKISLLIFLNTFVFNIGADWIHNIKNNLDVPVAIKTIDGTGQPEWFYLDKQESGRIWYGVACCQSFSVYVADADKQALRDSFQKKTQSVTKKYELTDRDGKPRLYDGGYQWGSEVNIDLQRFNDYDLMVNEDGSLSTRWIKVGGAGAVAWIKNITNTFNAAVTVDYKDSSRGTASINGNTAGSITLDKPVPYDKPDSNHFNLTIVTKPKLYREALAKLDPTIVNEIAAVFYISPTPQARCTYHNLIIDYSGDKINGSHLTIREIPHGQESQLGTPTTQSYINDHARPTLMPQYAAITSKQ